MASEEGTKMDSQTALPVYRRVTIAGLAFLLVAHLLLIVVNAAETQTAFLIFDVVAIVLLVVGAGLIWKYGRWTLIVAVILALLAGFGTVHVLPFGLQAPDSFFDFVPSVTALAGFLMALIGAIVAFVQDRQGDARTVPTGVERGAFGFVLAAILVLTVLSVILTPLGRETVSAEDRAGSSLVVMKNVRFEPDSLSATAGSSLRLVVDNDDLIIHTFTIEDLDIDVTVGPKSETLVELSPQAAGEYEYTCEVQGHEEMKGTLVVSP